MMPLEKHIISWDRLHQDCRRLTHSIVELDKKWKGIIAITRGGMIPAAIISRELGLRVVDSISLKTYSHQTIKEPTLLKDVSCTEDGDGFLVIDDLVDTGLTAKFVRDRLPKAYFVTVYAKPEGKALVDQFITEFSQDSWVYFPWDLALDYSKPISKIADE